MKDIRSKGAAILRALDHDPSQLEGLDRQAIRMFVVKAAVPNARLTSPSYVRGAFDALWHHVCAADVKWTVGADRGLPIDDYAWDGAAAQKSVFEWAGFDGDNPNVERARRAHMIYDADEPTLKGSYKLPFARFADGRLVASINGVNAVAQRLSATQIPASQKEQIQSIVDSYQEKFEKQGGSK